jgi:acetylornithine deacetylase/succinyl-diaminopimelate desuccinylase-like protein
MSLSAPFDVTAAPAAPLDWTAAAREAVGYFKDLLRFDTSNPPGNERPAAQYIAAILTREGIPFQMVHADGDPSRANIVARVAGSGAKAPLLLSGHLDVVPAEAGKWIYPPFSATEAGGYIWGRGALDMKNMVAMSLMTLVLLKRGRVALDRDVVFAAVADEEAGSKKGSLFLVDRFPELVRAEFVLTEVGGHTLHVGRGRFYPVQVAEKGICWFEISAEGDPGHGSMPHPHNALARLGRAIVALAKTRLPQHNTPVVEGFVRALAMRAPFVQAQLLPLLLRPMFSSALLGALEKPNRNPEQAMALNAMLRNTACPTIVAGGNKVNVIPSEAKVTVDGRMIPGQTVDSFLAEIRQVIGDGVRLTVLDQHEGTVFDSRTELFDAIASTLRRHDPEGVAVPYMIPGFTDAFAYQKLGATCYGFSPVQLDETINFSRLYHGHDERIPVSGFTWGLRVLFDLVRDFCGARG